MFVFEFGCARVAVCACLLACLLPCVYILIYHICIMIYHICIIMNMKKRMKIKCFIKGRTEIAGFGFQPDVVDSRTRE